MKKAAKSLVVSILGWQVRRLVKKHRPKVIAVVGSIGKTSTKLAIAAYLKQHFRVQVQEGNYNDILTVPLVFFGQENPPGLTNPISWLKMFLANEKAIKKPYPYDIVVLELGTDGPGQLVEFKKYLSPDITVVTAIAPEHMEFFGSLDEVAKEELSVAEFSSQLLVNAELCRSYVVPDENTRTYGLETGDFHLRDKTRSNLNYTFQIVGDEETISKVAYTTASETQIYGLLAAVGVGELLGFPRNEVAQSVTAIVAAPGRMRVLKGVNDTVILDDTYNSSPDAAIAALRALYDFDAPQRIALLGNMNELGSHSEQAHSEVGDFCDPTKLDLVVTLGKDANTFTAESAKQKGCRVETASSPYEAAEIIKKVLKSSAVILAKGSQNGVFAEEAVKQLLANPSDAQQLVRQSAYWLRQKEKQFGAPK